MSSDGKVLVVFDVDGTLVDSQAMICSAMAHAFADVGLHLPDRKNILAIVGLSLPQAMARLVPQESPSTHEALVAAYKSSFGRLRAAEATTLFPGAAEALSRLSGRNDVTLGIATGKSRKGLAHMLATFGLSDLFATRQTADEHPSKPDPAMLFAAMEEVGAAPERSVMVGDTTFDIEMAHAAGMASIGVTWGYHPVDELRRVGPTRLIDNFQMLDHALAEAMGQTA